MAKVNRRADHTGQHRTAYDRNRDKLMKLGGCCGICGKEVDTSIKDPSDPLAPVIDHIIPIAKGGHPSSIENLQLAHRWCNRQKADKLFDPALSFKTAGGEVGNEDLPLHVNWQCYKALKSVR